MRRRHRVPRQKTYTGGEFPVCQSDRVTQQSGQNIARSQILAISLESDCSVNRERWLGFIKGVNALGATDPFLIFRLLQHEPGYSNARLRKNGNN